MGSSSPSSDLQRRSPVIVVIWSILSVYRVAAGSAVKEGAASVTALPVSWHRPGTVTVKLKGRGAASSLLGTQLGFVAAPGQLAAVSVPEGKSPGEYSSELEAFDEVDYAEPNYLVRLLARPSDPLIPSDTDVVGGIDVRASPAVQRSQYHLSLTHALEAWDLRTDATGVKVCIIDTGVDSDHPDLLENVSPTGYDAGDYSPDGSLTDEFGHGTLVAGIVGAVGNNSLFGAGIAWRVQLLSCKIFPNGSELADVQSAQTCLRWCIDQGAQVSCNSWGLLQASPPSRSLHDTIAAANAAGHIAVFAAGNDNVDLDTAGAKAYPASYSDLPNLISVASTDPEGHMLGADSNFGGQTVTIAAPGVDILSTVPGGEMAVGTGTSFAAPQVAGALALLLAEAQAKGFALKPCHYKALLIETAQKTPGLDGKVQANGLLDVQAALEALASGEIPPCLPSAVPAPSPGQQQSPASHPSVQPVPLSASPAAGLAFTPPPAATPVTGGDFVDAVGFTSGPTELEGGPSPSLAASGPKQAAPPQDVTGL